MLCAHRSPLSERPAMSFFIKKMPRRVIVQALIALPALSLFRKLPEADAADPLRADPNEIVEINGWILKRSDLA
ncbi:msl4838 [Mesorhizobium japonicum MAFF 303099]|uniref:Msl4838 protein n=5 Tax=Mesorhizobium TaxID=68287 RepID=Q98D65_RHILO|nr:msl4838 [Mesorhizobium japonicum MAFF 303099]